MVAKEQLPNQWEYYNQNLLKKYSTITKLNDIVKLSGKVVDTALGITFRLVKLNAHYYLSIRTFQGNQFYQIINRFMIIQTDQFLNKTKIQLIQPWLTPKNARASLLHFGSTTGKDFMDILIYHQDFTFDVELQTKMCTWDQIGIHLRNNIDECQKINNEFYYPVKMHCDNSKNSHKVVDKIFNRIIVLQKIGSIVTKIFRIPLYEPCTYLTKGSLLVLIPSNEKTYALCVYDLSTNDARMIDNFLFDQEFNKKLIFIVDDDRILLGQRDGFLLINVRTKEKRLIKTENIKGHFLVDNCKRCLLVFDKNERIHTISLDKSF